MSPPFFPAIVWSCLLLLVGALLPTSAVLAQSFDSNAVRRAVDDYLKTQIKGLPGQASYTIETIDQRTALAPCDQLDVGTTTGARLWGRTSVRVRCVDGANWTLLVPVKIHVVSDYLVSARPLSAGQQLEAADIVVRRGDLTELPVTVLSEPAQAIGQLTRNPVPVGQPLRTDMLRTVVLIQQGQTVKLISRGPGFEVSNEGKAMSAASRGQVVQVRLNNGQVVSGLATASGVVELGQ